MVDFVQALYDREVSYFFLINAVGLRCFEETTYVESAAIGVCPLGQPPEQDPLTGELEKKLSNRGQ